MQVTKRHQIVEFFGEVMDRDANHGGNLSSRGKLAVAVPQRQCLNSEKRLEVQEAESLALEVGDCLDYTDQVIGRPITGF